MFHNKIFHFNSSSDRKEKEIQKNLFPDQVNSNESQKKFVSDIGGWSHTTHELLDSLPPIWTRGLLYFFIIFSGFLLPWVMFSEIDEVKMARGQLEFQGTSVTFNAKISSKDIGYIKKGMPVKIKFDAYPFQEYGTIEGRFIDISPTHKHQINSNYQLETYDLKIHIKQTCIQTRVECIILRPGETATAEITIRQRRIFEFLINSFQ